MKHPFLAAALAIALLTTSTSFAQGPGAVNTNLSVWLKSNTGPERSVGVPAANGDAISRWLDMSGNNRHYIPVAGPTLVGQALNFNPAVEIVAGGFDAPAGSELGTDWTVITISKKLASDQDGRLFDGHITNYLWSHWGTFTNSLYLNGNPSNHNSGIATTTGIQNLHLHSYVRTNATNSIEARADGTSLNTFAATNSANGVRIDIDAGNFAASEHSDAQVGEMIIYSRALTAAELIRVESYLAVKFGITATHNYVTSGGTTVWDYTANAAFNHDIVGIARDDNSLLDQRKSRSINANTWVTIDKAGAFPTNNSYLVWGDNNAVGQSSNISPTFSFRSARVWKTAVSGTPGNVTFSIDLAAAGLPSTLNVSNYSLLIDNDTDFSSGSTVHTTGASLVGGVLTFTNVALANNQFFTVGVSNYKAPGNVSANIATWLKADGDVWKGPSDPAGNNDAITTWRDMSGYGHHYTAVAGPTLVNSTINFNPSVEILNGGFDAPAGAELGNEWTTFFVSRKLPSDVSGRLFDGHTSNYLWAWWDLYTNSLYMNGNPAAHASIIATQTGNTNLHLHTYKRAVSGSLEARVEGTSLNTFATSTSANGIRIDIDAGAFAGESSDARIGEMIIYNSPLSASEVDKVETYLGVKYGLTLTHDYVAADGSVVWNIAGNAGYNSDIAGIGRDDLATLSQQKSTSVNNTNDVTIDAGAPLATDNSYLLWGNNAGTNTSTNVPSAYKIRSGKVWKAAVKGTPGQVTLSVNLSGIGLPNSNNAGDYALLIDTDNDFSSGATAHTTGATLVGGVLTFTNASLANNNFFAIAVANASFPGNVSTPAFWVKGDVGTVGASDVSQWIDQSGFSNNVSQSTVANQPDLLPNNINTHSVVNFVNGTDLMQFANPILNANSTVFSVAIPMQHGDWRSMFRGALSDHPMIIESGAGTRLGYFDNDNGGFQPSGFTWLQNEPAIVQMEMYPGDVNFRKNGTQGASITSINLTALRLDYFGNYQAGTQRFGRIAETIIYNNATKLTTTEKEKIESYLAVKYGITLTHNYLAGDGTITWNTTTNAGYNTNVAGVGRDDAATLDQRTSISVNAGAGLTMTNGGGAFGTDKSFVIWGNDGGTATSFNVPSGYTLRGGRTWKVAVTGTPGLVSVSVDLTSINLPNSGNATDYALLKDTDADFSSGATAHTTGASLIGNVLTFTNVSFSNNDTFAFAASNIALPAGVAGAVFWVKGETGVVGASDVSQWTDQSGFNNNAVQATVANQPNLLTSNINFRNSIEFLANSDLFTLTSAPATLNSTVFTVAASSGTTGNWRTMFRSQNNDHPFILESGSTRLGYWNGAFQPSGLTWTPNEVAVASMELRTGDVNFRKNGTQGASITTINLTNRDLYAFGNYQGGGQQFGRIAETIIFNTASPLTTTEKEKIESYLAVKYGVTLTHNYLAANGTTITWNTTTNAAYSNNIAGVGRDDQGSLDQRISRSVNAGSGLTVDKGGAFGIDKSFLIVGNDGGTATNFNVPPAYSLRGARSWKVAVTGTPGVVNISVDLTTISLPNTGNASDYALLKDTDADFSTGSTPHTTGASLVGNTLTFTNVSFSNNDTFAFAAANVPLPGGVAGAVFWVKGETGVVGTTDVSQWTDQSGFSNNAVQATVANQPALLTSNINFRNSIEFQTGTDIFTLTNPPANLNSTIFTVAASSTFTNNWRTMFRGQTNDHQFILETNSTRLGYWDGDNGGFQPSGFTWAPQETALASLELRTGDVNFRKNGTQGASITSINHTGLNLYAFGNWTNASQQFGRIAETIIYNTAAPLTTTEKERIESYLALKYGITLTHNYNSANGTVFWNTTTNTGYNNNITGVGRDDASSLSQLKSLSVHANNTVTVEAPGAIGTNNSFLVFGDDGATGTSTNIPAPYLLRVARVYKAAVTGTPGVVSVSFNLSTLSIPATGSASDFAILVDTDNDFSSGATAHTTGASLVGNVLTFTNLSLANNNFFTLAATNLVQPGGLSGGVFWYKGDVGVTGTTDVSQWADQMGNNKNATQGSVALQPTLQANNINSHASVDFNSNGDIMNVAASPAALNSTAFIVGAPRTNGTYRTFIRSSGGGDHQMLLNTGSTALGYYDQDGGGFLNSGFTWATNEIAIVGLEMRSSNVNFRKNGSQGTTFNTVNLASMNFDYLGNYPGGNQSPGRIAEYIVFSTASALTTADKVKVESYLGVKYGITLTHDYVTTTGTTIWNATTNATYHNDVAGIGRDDATGLDQRKSTSINANAVMTMDNGGAFSANRSYLIWGNTNVAMTSANSTDIPAGMFTRLSRVWKIGKTGTVGGVTVQVNLSAAIGSKTASDLRLFIDRNLNGSFTDETVGGGGVIAGATSVGGGVYQWTNVTFNDGETFTVGSANSSTPLPVIITSLNAKVINGGVSVDWSTASEINNDYFTVQKSADGGEFMDVVKVKGAGTSTKEVRYNYLDVSPLQGRSYYRLAQTDFDGKLALSKVVSVEYESLPVLFPNPATGLVSIEVKDSQSVVAEFVNSIGQRLFVKQTSEPGRVSWNVENLPRGVYFMTIKGDGKLSIQKLVLID